MNLRTFTPVNLCTRTLLLSAFVLVSASAEAERWRVDFSRRTQDVQTQSTTYRGPASSSPGFLKNILSVSEQPSQEIVILNTEKGFVPSTVHLRQGHTYKIYVVNVNENEKNVSFIMDSFSQHHATFFGQVRVFHIQPTEEGVFSFQSPETSAQGRVVISPSSQEKGPEIRMPASQR